MNNWLEKIIIFESLICDYLEQIEAHLTTASKKTKKNQVYNLINIIFFLFFNFSRLKTNNF
jgi:hypothetical protein